MRTPDDIRQYRREHGLTQRALAALLHYATDYVRQIEAGRYPMTQRFDLQIDALIMKKKLATIQESLDRR